MDATLKEEFFNVFIDYSSNSPVSEIFNTGINDANLFVWVKMPDK